MSTWSSNYRDNRWQRKRLEIMERDKFTCQSCRCGDEGETLNVHHIYYERGKRPWEYSDDLLVTWCEECHKDRHRLLNQAIKRLAGLNIEHFICVVELVNNQKVFIELVESLMPEIGGMEISHFGEFLSAIIKMREYAWKDGHDTGWEMGIKQAGVGDE